MSQNYKEPFNFLRFIAFKYENVSRGNTSKYFYQKYLYWDSNMTQQVKKSVSNLDNLSSSPRTDIVV